MRLLNVNSLDFEVFLGDVIPAYAILSHTWGDEEVSYSDYINKPRSSKTGHDKIHGCCMVAKSEGFDYVWVDTCCIDKSSSAELSEAINSMFNWYKNSEICYAYLSDVESSEDPTHEDSSFTQSRWLTRGWTLQELLAPKEVAFLARDWVEIGTKRSLRSTVSRVTRIRERVLDECRWHEYSVAQKMSWAADRRSTRLEDEAYCLMGLFDVNMPLLYGEGRKAFSRLQQEILKQSEDHSIFAWSHTEEGHTHTTGLMAPSPAYFRDASQVTLVKADLATRKDAFFYERRLHGETPFQVVNHLVKISSLLVERVKGIELQRLLNKPALYKVLELEHDEEGHREQSRPSSSHSDAQEDTSLHQWQEEIPIPTITIHEPDASSQPDLDDSELTFKEAFKHTERPFPPRSDGTDQQENNVSANVGPFDSETSSSWRSYIYDPAHTTAEMFHWGPSCGHSSLTGSYRDRRCTYTTS